MKYDFELNLKFLKFFNLHRVMPPPSNFSPKMDIRGRGHDSNLYGILILIFVMIKCMIFNYKNIFKF